MSDQYTMSPLFCAVRINELNGDIAGIDPRLVLFAYYDPKPYLPGDENLYFNFYRAVINLGALFNDCNVAFRAISSEINEYMAFKFTLNTMRALFCHNYPNENNYNVQQFSFNVRKKWLTEIARKNEWGIKEIRDKNEFMSLENSKWKVLLETLETKALSIINETREYLYQKSKDPQKFVEKIINEMVNNYYKDKNVQFTLIAEHLQAVKALETSERPKPMNWTDVKAFVSEQPDFAGYRNKYDLFTDDELVNQYIKSTWFNEMSILEVLKSKKAPKPALPFDTLYLLWENLCKQKQLSNQTQKKKSIDISISIC